MLNVFCTLLGILFLICIPISAKSYDSPDTIVVARDGTGEFRTVNEAIEDRGVPCLHGIS